MASNVVDYFGNAVKLSGSYTRYFSSISNNTISGTNSNTMFAPGKLGVTMIGGSGDDTYQSVDANTKIVEKANGGIDTIYAVSSLVVPDNVENVIVGYAPSIVGNDLNNYIVGSSAAQSFNGGAGNDTFTGNGGGDTYTFDAKSGYDLVTDFHTGSGAAADTVRLAGYSQFKTLADVKAAMTQVGNDVVLKLDATDAVKFANTKVADFTAANFGLHLDMSSAKPTFDDEFNSLSLWNGKTGSASSGTWRTDFGFGAPTDSAASRTLASLGDKEIYVDPAMKGSGKTALGLNPFSIDDGVLTIHAGPTPVADQGALYGYKFTSGFLSTKSSFTQTYGYFEAKVEVPAGTGVHPAFWLFNNANTQSELDVMEGYGDNNAIGTTHSTVAGKDVTQSASVFTPDLATSGFHTYGVLWTPQTVTWYMDGTAVKTVPTPADMHSPMYMMVNMALDHNTPANFTGADMKVDYVRAYSLADAQKMLAGTDTASTPVATAPSTPATTDPSHSGTTTGDTTHTTAPATTTTPADTSHNTTSTPTTPVSTTPATDTSHSGTTADPTHGTTSTPVTTTPVTGSSNTPSTPVTSTPATTTDLGATKLMIGTSGNDVYTVNSSNQTIVEAKNGGIDLVLASVDYALPDNVETLKLTGSALKATGNDLSNVITGNDLNNILTGLGGNDVLDGGKGADTMIGGTGDDGYYVDNAGDKVIEKPGEGTDLVYASIDYTLTDNVERLVLTGSAHAGTGNALDNILTGNDLDNTLTGLAGNDVIDGGKGADTMIGGTGDDGYYVDNAGDKVIEKPGEGFDMVTASVDYALPDNVESLVLTGNAKVGTGNDLNNSIIGNGNDNILSGGKGADVIDGKAGDDIIDGGAGNDRLTGGAGHDTFVLAKGFGHDTITDFNVNEDKFDWSTLKAANVKPVFQDVGADVVVKFGDDQVTLLGVHASDLTSHHVFG